MLDGPNRRGIAKIANTTPGVEHPEVEGPVPNAPAARLGFDAALAATNQAPLAPGLARDANVGGAPTVEGLLAALPRANRGPALFVHSTREVVAELGPTNRIQGSLVASADGSAPEGYTPLAVSGEHIDSGATPNLWATFTVPEEATAQSGRMFVRGRREGAEHVFGDITLTFAQTTGEPQVKGQGSPRRLGAAGAQLPHSLTLTLPAGRYAIPLGVPDSARGGPFSACTGDVYTYPQPLADLFDSSRYAYDGPNSERPSPQALLSGERVAYVRVGESLEVETEAGVATHSRLDAVEVDGKVYEMRSLGRDIETHYFGSATELAKKLGKAAPSLREDVLTLAISTTRAGALKAAIDGAKEPARTLDEHRVFLFADNEGGRWLYALAPTPGGLGERAFIGFDKNGVLQRQSRIQSEAPIETTTIDGVLHDAQNNQPIYVAAITPNELDALMASMKRRLT